MENSNVANFACKYKKIGTTSLKKEITCVSLANEGKT
jgi:hypothetical protein